MKKYLEKIGKKFNLDLLFYIDSFTWTGTAHTSAILRGVATTFLMARLLSVTTFGEFRYILAVFGIAGMFSLNGIHPSIIRGVTRGDTIIIKEAIKRILGVSLLGSLLLFIISLLKFHQHEERIAIAIAIVGLLFPLYCLSGLYGPILLGKNQIKKVASITTFTNLVFSLLFFPIVILKRELVYITLGYFAIDVILRLSCTLREIQKIDLRGNANEHLHLGKHMSLITIMQAIAFQIDQLLIQHFFGYASLANYNIALLIPDQIKDFASSISNIVLRRYSEHKDALKVLQNTRRHFWIVLLGSATIILGYAIAAPLCIKWLFPAYRDQTWVSVLYATSLLSIASMVGVNFFQAHHQTKSLWRLFSINTLVQIGANLALIPFYGNLGAIYSRILSRLITLPFTYPHLKKET